METHTITRSGRAPLQFEGEILSSATSKTHSGPCETRHWDLILYRTAAGSYVLAVSYHTRWDGEHDRYHAWACATLDEVREALLAYQMTADLVGFPPGRQFDEKRAYTEKQLRQCWEIAVAELLAEFPEQI